MTTSQRKNESFDEHWPKSLLHVDKLLISFGYCVASASVKTYPLPTPFMATPL